MDGIVAITVTFNDYAYLEKAIESLRAQTIPVAKIIIVDNNSNEEACAKLRQQEDEQLEVLWLKENLGGAGGFEAGMQYAAKKYDPDWYWLMDADACPRLDCLEKLIAHAKDVASPGILAPLIYGKDFQKYQLYHHKVLSRFLDRDLQKYQNVEEIPAVSEIEADAFVGPLVSREAVKQVGIADGSLFIYGDDVEYTYRVSQKLPVLLIKDAIIEHRDPSPNGQQLPNGWWKDYYSIRNRIFFVREFQANRLKKAIGIALVCLRGFKYILKAGSLPVNVRLKQFRRKLLVRSLLDGIKNKRGKTIDPAEFLRIISELSD